MKMTLALFQYDRIMPLAAGYLAIGLEQHEIEYRTVFINVDEFIRTGRDINGLVSQLTDENEILAIGCYSDMLPFAILAVRIIKHYSPEKVIVLGGIGPGIVAEEIIKSFDFIDFVISGCGIEGLPKLIKLIGRKGDKYSNIIGLYYRKMGAVIRPKDILSWYTPRQPSYRTEGKARLAELFLVKTSSGCPYACTFCYGSTFLGGRSVEKRKLIDVIAEIKFISLLKGRESFRISFIDEAFITDKKRIIEFCRLLIENEVHVSWMCYGRVGCTDANMLALMNEAGCNEIYYGVESGSNRILGLIKKGFTKEEALRALIEAYRIIPRVTASFIYRYPFESLREFIDTYAFLQLLRSKGIRTQLHPLMPLKGSSMYRQYYRQLRFSNSEPSSYIGNGDAISTLPEECISIINSHPRVFYDYGFYHSEGQEKILEFIKEHRIALS